MTENTETNGNNEARTQRRQALLALALDAEPPNGSKPDLAEIALWQEGRLSDRRAREVKAFVARDAECYALWSSLIDSERQLAPDANSSQETKRHKKTRFVGWRFGMTGTGIAAAVLALFVVVIRPQLIVAPDLAATLDQAYSGFDANPNPLHWSLGGGKTKGGLRWGEISVLERGQRAIAVGIRGGLSDLIQRGKLQGPVQRQGEWQRIIAQYPGQTFPCGERADLKICRRQDSLLQNFGRWIALMHLYCLTDEHPNTLSFWRHQQAAADRFVEAFATDPELDWFNRRSQRLYKALKQDHAPVCEDLTALMIDLEEAMD